MHDFKVGDKVRFKNTTGTSSYKKEENASIIYTLVEIAPGDNYVNKECVCINMPTSMSSYTQYNIYYLEKVIPSILPDVIKALDRLEDKLCLKKETI